jgi:hypothetical protein
VNGYQFVSNFPDDREAFKVIEKVFLKAFGIKKSSMQQEQKITEISK